MAPDFNFKDHAVPSAVAAASCVEAASSGIHAAFGTEHRTFHPVSMDQHAQLRRTADNLHTPEASSSAATLQDGRTFAAHMLAGAAAGVTEHTAMYPVDTIKTRMQALSHPGQRLHGSVVRALRAVVRREGVAGLYRGVGAVAWGAG
eukprot:GHRQ01014321.1.p1 GENE.GHRQ01014321.1~~GHRQ01014321.1.p1  ORF type:complete len:147 (+),score=49.55 GHRQ01014321.1:800-1240(+)